MTTERQKTQFRWILFWTFWGIFVLTSVAVLAMLFLDFGSVQESERKVLVNTFLTETGVAIIALFYSLFGLSKKGSESDKDGEIKEIKSRDNYIKAQVSAINRTKNELVLSVPKLHPEEKSQDAKDINDALRRASGRGVKIRVLVAANEDRLAGAIQILRLETANLRFDPTLVLSDLSFLCIDNELIIAGTRTNERKTAYSPSDDWYEIRSGSMIISMIHFFDQRWFAPATLTLEQMLRRYLPIHIQNSGVISIAEQLGLPQATVKNYESSYPFYILLIGRPGSGKSTIARSIVDALTAANIGSTHVSDLNFFYEMFKEESLDSFQKTEDGGFLITDHKLFKAATMHLVERLRAVDSSINIVVVEMARRAYSESLDIFMQEGIQPDLVVYVDVPLNIALQRNIGRKEIDGAHYVSDEEMRSTFSIDDIDLLEKRTDISFLRIENPTISETASEAIASKILGEFKNSIQKT